MGQDCGSLVKKKQRKNVRNVFPKGKIKKVVIFDQYLALSWKRDKISHGYSGRRIRSYELVCDLSNDAISNDLSHPQGHDILECQIARKSYKIELYLQWQIYKKSWAT